MTSVQQRQTLLGLIDQACADGARRDVACRQVGLSRRSVQRWQGSGVAEGDQRLSGKRRYVRPANRLREDERQGVMAVLNSEAFKDLPPARSCLAWPTQASMWPRSPRCTGCCASKQGQLAHRSSERAAQKRSKPRALAATGPDQVFCWDMVDDNNLGRLTTTMLAG